MNRAKATLLVLNTNLDDFVTKYEGTELNTESITRMYVVLSNSIKMLADIVGELVSEKNK